MGDCGITETQSSDHNVGDENVPIAIEETAGRLRVETRSVLPDSQKNVEGPIQLPDSIGGGGGNREPAKLAKRSRLRRPRVIVVDQESVRWFVWEGFSQLLDHPASRWIRGEVEVQNPASLVVDREPDVQQSEPNGRNDEEVHSRDHVLVIPEECHPSLLLGRVGFCPRYVARGGRQTHFDAEL